MIILIVENNTVKILEECEKEKDLPQEWTLGDTLPYQGVMRYEEYPDYFWMRQIYVKSDEREKGIGTMLMRSLEDIARKKRKRIRVISTTSTSQGSDIFQLFLEKLGYKEVSDNSLPYEIERIIFEKCF